MAHELLHTNDLCELRMRTGDWNVMTPQNVAVLCIFGNTATFHRAVTAWDESPAVYATFVLSVKTTADEQASYIQMLGDSDDPHDFTGSDPGHTDVAVSGVVESLMASTQARSWIIHCASGGCVSAVEIARMLLVQGHDILALLADSGVPGSGKPLPANVPVSVWSYQWDSYWSQRDLADIWRSAGHRVVWDYTFNWGGHAAGVDRRRMQEALRYLLGSKAHFMRDDLHHF